MGFDGGSNLVGLKAQRFEFAVRASDDQLFAALVKSAAVSDYVARINRADFLYSPDVPYLDDTIRVS